MTGKQKKTVVATGTAISRKLPNKLQEILYIQKHNPKQTRPQRSNTMQSQHLENTTEQNPWTILDYNELKPLQSKVNGN